ncbi:MAG: hypothetical protein RSB38_07185 [Oscillospiraceae bacterium]
MAEPLLKLWKRNQTQLFLNIAATSATSPTWGRVRKSTQNEIQTNPKIETYPFIDVESEVDVLEEYKLSFPQELMTYEGDPLFDFIFKIFYEQKTGNDVVMDALIVFPKAGTTAGSFLAWKVPVTVAVSGLNAVDKKVAMDWSQSGDVVRGTVTVASGVPTFVAG